MDRAEAIRIGNQVLTEYRSLSYLELSNRIDEITGREVEADTGNKYQLEVMIFWDDKKRGNIRVALDVAPLPPRWRDFFRSPVNLDFIKASDESIVGEERELAITKDAGKSDLYQRCIPEIRTLLIEKWDPVGVKDMAGLEREYDTYVSGAIGVMVNGGDWQKVSTYLAEIDQKQFGYDSNAEAFNEIAKKAFMIFSNKKSSEED